MDERKKDKKTMICGTMDGQMDDGLMKGSIGRRRQGTKEGRL